MKIFVNYKQQVYPDHEFARQVAERLRAEGHLVFRDESNLLPSESWPERLEREVRECDAMVSLVSNAALQSTWVLNEIDLALQLKKRLVPVLLEEIRESLRFQAFRPRFMSIQWIQASGDRSKDLESIASALREVRLESYRDLVEHKLGAHGITDGGELLEAAFGALFQSHWPAIVLQQPTIVDTQRRLSGEPPMSLAEALRNHIEHWASIQSHNASNFHQHGQDDHAKRLTWQVQRLRCLADILETVISAWTKNSLAKRHSSAAPSEPFIHLFNNSDGEQAFVSPDSPMVQGGRPDKPVPVGHIVCAIHIPNPRHIPNEPKDTGTSQPAVESA